ncbi:isoleucine--tRNA ligase [Patescibacteria group bacterium]|nr:isoleucine--tRNA ligase [Patescibacteria group bacterium]
MSNPKPTPSGRPDFPAMEEEILDFWDKKRIFERSIEEKSENKVFSFYDGPPFATGLPHPGHLLQSTIKDAIPRYWTMNGYRAQRIWGWDCHGLPVENLIEKDLKLKSKKDILDFGIDKFNDACCSSVLTYDKEWRKYIRRIGRWVDMDHSYKTMDDSYIETVWWVFSELYKKDLVYKDFRVSMYCPRCATPLSNHEITMGHSYRDEVDPAITVKLKVVGEDKTYLLIWTTTPWTLPANTAVAVHSDLTYIKVQIPDKDEVWILAESRQGEVLKKYLPLDTNNENSMGEPVVVLEKMKGSDLVGLKYEPLYSFMTLPEGKDGFRVVDMPYVSAEDGTGLVHTAPAFGEDDFQAAKLHNLPLLLTVNEEGKLNDDMGPYAGMPIKDADPLIVADLEKRGLLIANEKIEHSVPECWRCGTVLMYRAQDAWFVDIQKIKPKLAEANKKIQWVPGHIKEGRFGKGLEMAPDWNISRTRFWGAPLPVWICEACNERRVFGSIAELKEAAGGKLPEDFSMHRPGIDKIEVACKCGGTMKRTEYVFDCWFESGSMPYASVHYPFENQKDFEAGYPADFIGEAQDQTRGWFYTMHVLAVALFNKPAAKNIVVTGMMLAEDGKKMSKSKKNFTDPYDLMTTLGADALRFYMLSSPIMQAEALNFKDEECSMIQRTIFGTLWNVRQFYLTYAEGRDVQITKPQSLHILDRWIYSRLNEVTEHVTKNMNAYDIAEALRPIRAFVDDLSTWWLRRSRERIKNKENPDDSLDALRTLREVLLDFARLLAPFAPFISERLYQDLEGGKMSVHLDKWPKVDEGMRDEAMEKDMSWIRDIVNAGLEQRVTTKLPVRQALSSIKVSMKDSESLTRISQKGDLLNLIRDELNVLNVELLPASENQSEDWVVELDTVLTPELKKMGLHREVVRHVMQLRKQSGMTPQDQIAIILSATGEFLRADLESMKDQIGQDTKAIKVEVMETQDVTDGLTLKWEDNEIGLVISKG